MKYKGFKLYEENEKLFIEGVKDFNLEHIFECGQCFRWNSNGDDSYYGIVKDKGVNVIYRDNILEISNTTIKDFIDIWYDYFDLGRDYENIKLELSKKDSIMKQAVEFGYGIRLLNQDTWETLISFIISANNNIARIKKSVEILSQNYGKKVFNGRNSAYTFPTAKELSEIDLEDLYTSGAGFRCKYILKTAKDIVNNSVNLYKLDSMDTDIARKKLTTLSGVGNKVADCVLLFSGVKYNIFPTDVWVKRVMEELYFKREASMKEIQEFSKSYFKDIAGFAQQYLFYYARQKKIGVK